MDVKINTMLSKGEDAVTPLGQFRAGLVTELELLTILLKKK